MLGFSGCFASQCYNPLTMQSYQQVSDFIERHQLLNRGDRVVIGVSGGPDSLCLLDSLHHLGYPLICAHLDHGLRPESSDEAAYAKSIAQSYNLPFEIEKQDVALKAGSGVSLEEAARLARYNFLVRVARKNDVHVIATGHTADDQVETVLMHFLRGTGPSGLRGMLPDTPLDSWVGIADAQGILLNWNYQADMDSAPAALFLTFWQNLVNNTMQDNLPDDYHIGVGSTAKEIIRQLVTQPENPWWNDSSTPEREIMVDIFKLTFEESYRELKKDFGKDPTAWQWGDLHTITFQNQALCFPKRNYVRTGIGLQNGDEKIPSIALGIIP